MSVSRWNWSEGNGPARLAEDLRERGASFFHHPEAIALSRTPRRLVDDLFGGTFRPVRIRPLTIQVDDQFQDGYPKTSMAARLHVDPPYGGFLPPHVQIMVCRRPAEHGGENLVLDAWRLLEEIEAGDRELFDALFATPRRIQMSGEVVFGPTIAWRRRNLVCLYGAVPPRDPVGRRFRTWIERSAPLEFRAEAGDVYVNSNHRMLHGRRAFSDPRREFERLLVWFVEPFSAPARLVEPAAAAAEVLAAALAPEPAWVREELGVGPCERPERAHERLEPGPGPGPREEELDRVLARCHALGLAPRLGPAREGGP